MIEDEDDDENGNDAERTVLPPHSATTEDDGSYGCDYYYDLLRHRPPLTTGVLAAIRVELVSSL